MPVPESEIPDMTQIRQWVVENMPDHYRLNDIKCWYGTDSPGLIPDDWEISIEYTSTMDESVSGMPSSIDAHEAWSEPLIAKIRSEWPAPTVRIAFKEHPQESK